MDPHARALRPLPTPHPARRMHLLRPAASAVFTLLSPPWWVPALLLLVTAAAALGTLRATDERWRMAQGIAAVCLLFVAGVTGGLWWAGRGGSRGSASAAAGSGWSL